MKRFLVLFACTEGGSQHQAWMSLSPEEREKRFRRGQEAQTRWQERHSAQIVTQGELLGSQAKRVDSQGVTSMPSGFGKYLIVEAASADEVTQMFLGHPHFADFPGDAIETYECSEARGREGLDG